jgi:hypothetical protein
VNERATLWARRTLLRRGLGLLIAPAAPAWAADERLMLVIGTQSRLTALNSLEVHRLFLGLTVIVHDRRLRPLRNESDELMRDVFFQNIVSMSESAYDRRMLALTMQQVGTVPVALPNSKAVFDALAADADAVSYAWAEHAAKDPRIRALRVLWRR